MSLVRNKECERDIPAIYSWRGGPASTPPHPRQAQQSCTTSRGSFPLAWAHIWTCWLPERCQIYWVMHEDKKRSPTWWQLDSAQMSITYVELQWTFMSSNSWQGCILMHSWLFLNSCSHCKEECAYSSHKQSCVTEKWDPPSCRWLRWCQSHQSPVPTFSGIVFSSGSSEEYLALLQVEMTACVARLMICARHLYNRVSMNKLKSSDLPALMTLIIKHCFSVEAVTV